MKRLVGHTPTYTPTGAGDAYWLVRCSCGWTTPTAKPVKATAKAAFDNHKATVIAELTGKTLAQVHMEHQTTPNPHRRHCIRLDE